MSTLSQYVYCVTPATAPRALDLEERIPAGESIGGGVIHAICHDGMAAIVGQAAAHDPATMRKDDLARMLLAHQKVIEVIMESSPAVIPFRLGTYARTEAEVVGILQKGSRLIHRLFSEIGRKIEMDVVVTWADFASVLKEAGQEKEIEDYKQGLCGNGKAVTMDDQMKVGFMVKRALDRQRLEISRQIAGKLAAVSCAQCPHENMDDTMVMNCAFLVEVSRREQFERALEESDAGLARKLNCRCVGPLAPYSFYTLDLKRIEWQDIDWARHLMGLERIASPEEIKKAFQQSALTWHPDHNGDSGGGKRDFDQLIRARQMVLEYVQACAQVESEARFTFSQENVSQNSLLVKVRNGHNHG